MTVLRGSCFFTRLGALLILGIGASGIGAVQAQTGAASAVVRQAPSQLAVPLPETVQAPALAQTPGTTVQELQQLIRAKQVQELRTTYNSTYGTSLLLKPDEQVFYIALFHQQQFWRVIKTSSAARAEQVYQAFVQQTQSLAEVDIQRQKMEAEQLLMQKALEAKQGQLSVLQADLAFQREQEKEVLIRQANAEEEARELEKLRQQARQQLTELEKEIKRLETQHDALPSTAASSKRPQQSGK
ncbi:MAG: DUF2968 domain-containing protein [Pigmentiphaga sp.]|nr:DUF2968 domain-containing protein [Pigmentiphaga sp.]